MSRVEKSANKRKTGTKLKLGESENEIDNENKK